MAEQMAVSDMADIEHVTGGKASSGDMGETTGGLSPCHVLCGVASFLSSRPYEVELGLPHVAAGGLSPCHKFNIMACRMSQRRQYQTRPSVRLSVKCYMAQLGT